MSKKSAAPLVRPPSVSFHQDIATTTTSDGDLSAKLEGLRSLKACQAAKLLEIPRSSMYDLVRSGEIPSVRYGAGRRKRIRILVVDLEAFVACRKVGKSPPRD